MKQQELNAMKYGDLLKLAKEKLNITRRISKEKLVEKLLKLHENFLSDTNFISADESTENSTMESEVLDKPVVSKRGRKRGNQDSDEKKPSISSKKAKKAKKESIERTLNSTFSVDEDEEVNDTTITLPAVVAKPIKSTIRKLRGKKKTEAAYLTEESSINESETEKTPISQAVNKKPAKLAMNMKPQPTNSRDCRIPVVMLKQLESTKQTSSDDSEPEKNRAKKPFTQAEPQSLENETTAKKIPPKKLKKSSSTASVRKTPTIEQEMKKAPLKRTRSSTGNKAELVGEQISIEETKEMPAKKLEKSVSNETPAASPQVEPCVPSPTATAVAVVEIEKKTVLRRTSTHQLRSRISTINIPAKIAMTPVASAKRGVHFTAKNGNASSAISTNISKANKPKAAPNFAEIHQKNFLKMQSVDEYVEKKRARTETMTATSAKTNRTKSVLNNTFTPQAKPAVAKPIQASTPSDSTMNNMKFNFVSGLQKPVFTAKGQVVNEKQRVMATVKENLHNVSQIPVKTTTTTTTIELVAKGKRKASMLNVSRDINASKLSLAGKQILKGVRTNRRFDLQMQHRNMKN